jgi:hypothetical protein
MKEHVLLLLAMHELKIDVPVMDYRIVGDRIELYLYGGQVLSWEPPAEEPVQLTSKSPKVQKARSDATHRSKTSELKSSKTSERAVNKTSS